jgi:hypothetical protein
MPLQPSSSGGISRHGFAISDGAKHGLATLSHGDRMAAQGALDKLNSLKGNLGLRLGATAQSATVFGGAHTLKLGAAALAHGQGSDTFMSGAHSMSTHALSKIGNDTVVSGSTSTGGHKASDARGAQHFNLNGDTINVKGATAEGVKGARPDEAKTSHTIMLADKTTVTIAGLSHHDIGKISH